MYDTRAQDIDLNVMFTVNKHQNASHHIIFKYLKFSSIILWTHRAHIWHIDMRIYRLLAEKERNSVIRKLFNIMEYDKMNSSFPLLHFDQEAKLKERRRKKQVELLWKYTHKRDRLEIDFKLIFLCNVKMPGWWSFWKQLEITFVSTSINVKVKSIKYDTINTEMS